MTLNTQVLDGQHTCPQCGFVDSGRFCSQCGFELTAKASGPLLEAASAVFKVDAARNYGHTYWRILKSPTAVTLRLAEDRTYHQHLSFFSTSLGLYVLMAFSAAFAIRANVLVIELLTTTIFFVTLLISTSLSYLLLRRASHHSRTSTAYLKLVAIMLGFTLPLAGTAQGLQRFYPEAGAVALLAVSIPGCVYCIRVISRFWQLRARKVFAYWAFSSLVGGGVGSALTFASVQTFGVEAEPMSLVETRAPSSPDQPVLSSVASELNRTLPAMVDADTELMNVTGVQDTLIYNLRLVNASIDTIDVEAFVAAMRPRVRNGTCTNPQTRDAILQKGVTMRFAYADKDRRHVAAIDVLLEDCSRAM